MADINYDIVFNDGDFVEKGKSIISTSEDIVKSQEEVSTAFTKSFKAAIDATEKEDKALQDMQKTLKSTVNQQNEANITAQNLSKTKLTLAERIQNLKTRYEDLAKKQKDSNTLSEKEVELYNEAVGALKDKVSNLNILGTNVGQVTGVIKQTITVGKLWIRTLGVTRAAIIATGVGALAIALGSVVSFLTSTRKGQALLNKAFTIFGAVVETVTDKINSFGEGILKAVSNPKKAFEDLLDFVKGNFVNRFVAVGKVIEAVLDLDFKAASEAAVDVLTGVEDTIKKVAEGVDDATTSLKELVKESTALEDSRERIFDLEQKIRRETSESRANIKALNKDAEDTTLTYQERIEAAKKAGEIEVGLLAKRIALADENLRIIRKENELLSDEDKKEAIERETEAIEAKNAILLESSELQTTINNKLNTISNERIAKLDELKAKNQEVLDAITNIDLKDADAVTVLNKQAEVAIKSLNDQKDAFVQFAKELGEPTAEIEANFDKLINVTTNEFIKAKQDLVKPLEKLGEEKVKVKLKFVYSDETEEEKETRRALDGIAGSVKKLFESQQFQASFDLANNIADAFTGIYEAQIEGLEKASDERQEKIDQLKEEIELEQDLLKEGSISTIEGKKEELATLLAEQEAANKKANELRKKQIEIETAQALAQTAVQGALAVANVFTAHTPIPFVGVAIAAGLVATMIATISSANQQIKSLSLFGGAARIGDYTGQITPNANTDMAGSGSSGLAIVHPKTGQDTGIRIGGDESLVTAKTTRSIGHIIQAVEKSPRLGMQLNEWFTGIDSSPQIAARAASISQYNFMNQSVSKEEIKEVFYEVMNDNLTKTFKRRSKELASTDIYEKRGKKYISETYKNGNTKTRRVRI